MSSLSNHTSPTPTDPMVELANTFLLRLTRVIDLVENGRVARYFDSSTATLSVQVMPMANRKRDVSYLQEYYKLFVLALRFWMEMSGMELRGDVTAPNSTGGVVKLDVEGRKQCAEEWRNRIERFNTGLEIVILKMKRYDLGTLSLEMKDIERMLMEEFDEGGH